MLPQNWLKVSSDHDPVHYPEGDEAGDVQHPFEDVHVLREGSAKVRRDRPRRWVSLSRDRASVQGDLHRNIHWLPDYSLASNYVHQPPDDN